MIGIGFLESKFIIYKIIMPWITLPYKSSDKINAHEDILNATEAIAEAV